MADKPSYLYWPILLVATTFFSIGLFVSKTVNLCFYLLIFFSITTLIVQRNAATDFWLVCKKFWPINLAMFGTVAAIFAHQLFERKFATSSYDLPSRLALFELVFWAFLQVPLQKLKLINWGWIAGVIICTIQLYLTDKNVEGRPNLLVWYVELVMLLGVFSVLSIGWNESKSKFLLVAQIIAGACGLYSAYLSQTRGIWIAIPVFTLLMFTTFIKNWLSSRNFMIFIGIIFVAGIAFSTTDVVSRRINAAKQDISLYSNQVNEDTSLGVRFQLWQGSWIVFKENPIFGVGREHYSEAMHDLMQRKIISPTAASLFHSHNEILYNMMTLGLFGLVGILLIFLVPAYYFAKELRNTDRQIRASAAMGLSLCLGFMIFGMVDVMLLYKATDVFYCISAALFLAAIVKRKKSLISQASLV